MLYLSPLSPPLGIERLKTIFALRPIGHPQHRRRDFSSGRDRIRLSSAALFLLAVQKEGRWQA